MTMAKTGVAAHRLWTKMAVEILNNIREKGHQIKTIVINDDATSIPRIRS